MCLNNDIWEQREGRVPVSPQCRIVTVWRRGRGKEEEKEGEET